MFVCWQLILPGLGFVVAVSTAFRRVADTASTYACAHMMCRVFVPVPRACLPIWPPSCCFSPTLHTPTQASGDTGKNGYGQEVMEMLKKMKGQEYFLPDSLGLTPECKNLLRQLLHPDWNERIKVAGIMADPWFRTDLPPDALNMNDRYIANTRTCTQSEDGALWRVALGWPWAGLVGGRTLGGVWVGGGNIASCVCGFMHAGRPSCGEWRLSAAGNAFFLGVMHAVVLFSFHPTRCPPSTHVLLLSVPFLLPPPVVSFLFVPAHKKTQRSARSWLLPLRTTSTT